MSLDFSVRASESFWGSNARLSAHGEDDVSRSAEDWSKDLPLHHSALGLPVALLSIARDGISGHDTQALVLSMNLAKTSSAARISVDRHAVLDMTLANCNSRLIASREFARLTLNGLDLKVFETAAPSWSAIARALVVKGVEARRLPLRFVITGGYNSLLNNHWSWGHHHFSIYKTFLK